MIDYSICKKIASPKKIDKRRAAYIASKHLDISHEEAMKLPNTTLRDIIKKLNLKMLIY